MKKFYLIFFILALSGSFVAQQLVYKPTNPAFGGDTFNHQWLMSSAGAQNQFGNNDKTKNLLSDLNSLDSFTESLNRQLLSQLSRKLFGDQFGEGDLQPGTYVFGSLYLEVIQSSGGLLINILNTNTGEQSEIIIPN